MLHAFRLLVVMSRHYGSDSTPEMESMAPAWRSARSTTISIIHEAEQGVTSYYDANNRNLDRSVADFDVRQRMTFSGVWEIPFLRNCTHLACKVAGGWQLSGYGVLEEGQPMNVTTSAAYPNGDYNADNNTGGDRPNAPLSSLARSGFTRDQFLNGIFAVTDFPRPTAGQTGNLGRNAFRGPGFARVDLSLAKNFPIMADRANGSLRLESFNAFNRVNLNSPASNLTSNSFGKSTGAGAARVYQISLRGRGGTSFWGAEVPWFPLE